ncbi:MAG: ABC transporter substrate-binding protein, partial [Thermomicrobiaceae bacterium]|nr:ABC transporter substrate-binding protein [Thermomicrobiaceae bacterium]
LRALRFYNDALQNPERRGRVVEILKKHTPLKDDALYGRMVWPGLRADGRFDTAPVEEVQNIWLARGAIKQKVSVDKLVDFSYLEEAASQL